MEAKLLTLLTSTIVIDKWSASRSRRFIMEEKAVGIHWIGDWVDHRTGLDTIVWCREVNPDAVTVQPSNYIDWDGYET
jgi:hypothetical protein